MDKLPTSSHSLAWTLAAFFLIAFAAAILRAEPVHITLTSASF